MTDHGETRPRIRAPGVRNRDCWPTLEQQRARRTAWQRRVPPSSRPTRNTTFPAIPPEDRPPSNPRPVTMAESGAATRGPHNSSRTPSRTRQPTPDRRAGPWWHDTS